MQISETRTAHSLLETLNRCDCAFCEDGQLVRGTFKGNDAVVCDACGAPGAQFF